MSERFNPNPFEAAADKAEAERKKFWEDEVKAWQERQGDKNRIKKISKKELYFDIYNNLHDRLPAFDNSYIGRYRRESDEESLGSNYKDLEDKEKITLYEKMFKDIDEYLEKNGLMEMAKKIAAERYYRPTQEELFSNEYLKREKSLTDGEVQEFFMDLYYAMRKKGYDRMDLAS